MYEKYQRKRILCLGSFFTANYGDRAIYDIIRRAIETEGGGQAVPFSLKPMIANKYGSSMGTLMKIFVGALVVPKHYFSLYHNARKSSAVLIGGGNLIHDVYILTVVQFLIACLTIRAAGKKFLIFCVGVGPLSNRFSYFCIGMACLISNGVIVRDTLSKKTIEKCWGIKKRLRKTIVPDVVLSMGQRKKKSPSKMKPLVGISTMFYMQPGRYPNGNKKAYEKYLQRMEELVRLVVKRLNMRVLLFSTEPSEDQETVDTVMHRVQDLKDISSTRIQSLESAVKVTSSLDYHVGSRLHTLILSLANGGVPSIALSSHTRIIGLYTELDAGDLVYDISNFNPKIVIDDLEKLTHERGRVLLENVDKLRKRSKKGISEMVAEICSL